MAVIGAAMLLMVSDTLTRSSGMPAKASSMSASVSMAIPTRPTSPSARGSSESRPSCVGRSNATLSASCPWAIRYLKRAFVSAGVPKPMYCRIVQTRERYMWGWIPRVNGYSRGIHPHMYRSRVWTMRQYIGFGTPAETNARFKYLMAHGQDALNVAFDLPTQLGLDSDDPRADGEVGRVGMAIDTLADMEEAFAGIPLDRVSVSLTINGMAAPITAMYYAVAEKQGAAPDRVVTTPQNDILKEFVARGTWIYPVDPSLRLVADLIEFSARHFPRSNP